MGSEYTIAFAQGAWDELCLALAMREESAAVILAGFAEDLDRPTYIAHEIVWVPDEHYAERSPNHMSISSRGWVPALKRAADAGLHAVFVHTHPGSDPRPSRWDDEVDGLLSKPFRTRTGTDRFASLIIGGSADAPSFSGRVYSASGTARLARTRVIGQRIAIIPAFDRIVEVAAGDDVHERQIRAFGAAGQIALSELRVGVVGAGGTGSAVIEQLVRLGVGELVIVDNDHITPTNVSRIYGSTVQDAGRSKVQVAENNAKRIGLGTRVIAVEDSTAHRSGLEAIRCCDVVFGCTDDHTGRFNLSRLAFYYLAPVIDLGVAIDAVERIRSITGRITYVAPGEACLVCRRVIDPNVVREEAYDSGERQRLAGEGYARGLGEPDPSVVAYTTLVAAAGVADLLERLFDFGALTVPGETRLRIADRKVALRSMSPNPNHICGQPEQWGLGDQSDFLGQRVWPT